MGILVQARVVRMILPRRLADGLDTQKHKDHGRDSCGRAKDSDGNDCQIIARPVAWRQNVGYQYFSVPHKARHQ